MPYPNQVNRDVIINKAWELIEAEGADSLSLNKLASSLGVKAPSLYRHIGNKARLLQGVNFLTMQKLFTTLNQALSNSSDEPEDQLMAVFAAYRLFAHNYPRNYLQAMTNHTDAYRPDEDALERMVIPIQEIMTHISGSEKSLTALRGGLALIHGFVMLELNQQLRRGGDLEEAFIESAQAYLRGWRM